MEQQQQQEHTYVGADGKFVDPGRHPPLSAELAPDAGEVTRLRAELAAVAAELATCKQERDELLGRHLRLKGKYRALKYRPPTASSSSHRHGTFSTPSSSSSSSSTSSSSAAPSRSSLSPATTSSSSAAAAAGPKSGLSTLLYASSLPTSAGGGGGPRLVLRGPPVDPMAPTSPVVPRGAGRNRSGRAPHAPPPALLSAAAAAGVDEASPVAANVDGSGGNAGGSREEAPAREATSGPTPTAAAVEVAVGGAGPSQQRSVPTTSATRGAGRRLLAGVGLLLETSASAALTGGSGPSTLDQRPRSAIEGGVESSLPATDTSGTLNGAGSHRIRGNAPPSFIKAKKQRSEESEAALFEFDELGTCAEGEEEATSRDTESDEEEEDEEESTEPQRQRHEIAEALRRDEMAIYASSVPVAIPRRWVEEREDKKPSAQPAVTEEAQDGTTGERTQASSPDQDTFVAPHIYSLRTTSVLEDLPRSISYRPYWNDHNAGQ